MPKGAVFTFAVEGGQEERSLHVFTAEPTSGRANGDGSHAGRRTVRRWPLDSGEVDAALEELRDALQEIHDIAGNKLDLDSSQSTRTVERLLETALPIGYALFRERPGEIYNKSDLLAPGAFDPSVAPRIVEVKTPQTFIFPFELLQWHNLPDSITDPALRVRALLGMSAIVRRRIGQVQEKSGWSSFNHDPLAVTIFRHTNLEAAERESRYLGRSAKLVTVYGPWPDKEELPELPKLAAARHLLDSRNGIDSARRREDTVDILHLACHCNTTLSSQNKHFINVGGGEHGRILLGHLKAQIMKLESATAVVPRPLVFLNACGSAAPQMGNRVSFTKFFLEHDFVGVLGTLCDISDTVAAHFAMVFYQQLLRGRTVGEAMYDARWHLMDQHRNPLGLLYTFYGNPDLKVRNPRAGEVIPACTLSLADDGGVASDHFH